MRSDRKTSPQASERPAYEPPRALRLGDELPRGYGACLTGSSATGNCNPGGVASINCIQAGGTAISNCNSPGTTADINCNPGTDDV